MGKICRRCKKEFAGNKKSCDMCLLKCREYSKLRRQDLLRDKLCVDCGSKSQNGKTYCKDCLIKQKEKLSFKKRNRICLSCSNVIGNSLSRCEDCMRKIRDKQREIRLSRKKNSLCIKCGKKKTEGTHVKCDKCLFNQSRQFANLVKTRRSKGCCINCENKSLENNRFCESCYFKSVATKRTGSVKNWIAIKSKFDLQEGLCPYSGEKLEIGTNAALDHIIPVSKGGNNDMSNLQWISSIVNTMKWNFDETVFLNLVEKIFNYHKEKHLGQNC